MQKKSLFLVVVLLALSGALPVSANPPKHAAGPNRPATLAVIGDSPYGETQIADFPNLVSAINADPDVKRVVHVGDIKNGSSRCDTSYLDLIAEYFATLEDGLVYTPGDNEWTDCHRSNNGKYDPLERLAVLRDIFFADPWFTLGGKSELLFSQQGVRSFKDLPENAAWVDARVVFATLHVVGSRNGLAPSFGDDTTDELLDDPERRLAEVEHRTAAAIDWLDRAFALAKLSQAKGVVLFMQADTWPGSADDGFSEIIQRLARRAVEFGKPVLVVQGDSHVYRVDQPLASGDTDHGVSFAVPNLTRIVVQGATASEWLKLRVDPRGSELFSWERMMQ